MRRRVLRPGQAEARGAQAQLRRRLLARGVQDARPGRVGDARRRRASTSVDLPMPGSPPSSTSEPGTRPPPSTRSTSRMPSGEALGVVRRDAR